MFSLLSKHCQSRGSHNGNFVNAHWSLKQRLRKLFLVGREDQIEMTRKFAWTVLLPGSTYHKGVKPTFPI